MTVTATRLADAMKQAGEDQSSLARAIGITQGAVSKILQGKTANSRHLPRIAVCLSVPLPWLLGETDDRYVDLPTPHPGPATQFITMQVGLPSEAALARMYEGLLRPLDRTMPVAELARILAKRLPSGLSQLVDLLPPASSDAGTALGEGPQPLGKGPTSCGREPHT